MTYTYTKDLRNDTVSSYSFHLTLTMKQRKAITHYERFTDHLLLSIGNFYDTYDFKLMTKVRNKLLSIFIIRTLLYNNRDYNLQNRLLRNVLLIIVFGQYFGIKILRF